MAGGGAVSTPKSDAAWKILIVDGDEAVHRASREALADYRVEGRRLDLVSAHSADAAKTMLREQPGIVVIILEVVLETRSAGLELIDYIRGDLANQRLRIIVRTGFPEVAPELDVIERYDVDGYRVKIDLTADQLKAAIAGALRTFNNILALTSSRNRMARFLVATGGLLEMRTPDRFYASVLPRLTGLPGVGRDALFCTFADTEVGSGKFRVHARTGRFTALPEREAAVQVEPHLLSALEKLCEGSETLVEPGHCVLRLRSRSGITGMVYVESAASSSTYEWQTLELFRNKAAIAFENTLLLEELNSLQKAAVVALATLAEYKDNASTGHLQRIERLTTDIARELLQQGHFPGVVTEDFVEKIGLASILHDVGMICVPDEILTIPGELVEEDLKLIYRHAEIGHAVLNDAARPLRGPSFLSIGAEIARSHHERYDGTGYPDGLKGDAIPVAARITAVADVFDALISDRHYRRAWPADEAALWMAERAGADFDPVVIDAFVTVVRRLSAHEPEWFPSSQEPEEVGVQGGVGGRLRGLFGWLMGTRAR